MTKLHIDLETFSEADLKKVGLYRYAADPSTEITLFGYAVDNEPARVIDYHHGEPLPERIHRMLFDPSVQKIAHNAMFERVVLRHVWGIDIPIEQWYCTMIHARSLALPGALGLLTRAIGTSIQKIEDRTLIPRLCTPRYGGIAKNIHLWPSFKEYNRIDVESEREAGDKLARFPMPPHEWRLWHLDQKINDRGMPIDMTFVELASNAIEDLVKEATDTVKLQTAMANPNSRAQWLSWLQTRDIKAEDLTASTVDALRADEDVDPDVRSMLDLRKELASASIKKFETLTRSVVDDRMRGAFSFAGAARTGRWSGKGFQPHNLPRGVLEVEELELARDLIERNDRAMVQTLWGEVSPVVASLVRTAIAAPRGRKIVAADLASIETVMGAWAAGCRPLLKVFEDGLDAYKDYATHLFHIAYAAVTKTQRKLSKPAVLGCFAADTKVLTSAGWLPIVDVEPQHQLWDGVEWVAHGGVVDQGTKPVRDWLGIRVTSDHRILTGVDEWSPVGTCNSGTPRCLSALRLGASLLRGSGWAAEGASNATGCGAAADAKPSHWGTTSTPARLQAAPHARESVRAALRPSGRPSSQTSAPAPCGPVGTLRCYPDAVTPSAGRSSGTGRAAFGWPPSGRTGLLSCGGWLRNTATMIRARSLSAWTTMQATARRTADWLRAANRPATVEGCTGWSTAATGWSSTISAIDSPPPIGMSALSGDSWSAGQASMRSSATSTDAVVRTFDILNAGPRSRFMVLTAEGPVVAHNCGYGMGARGLQKYALQFGVVLTMDEAREHVRVYRAKYKQIVDFWEEIEQAAFSAVENRSVERAGEFQFRFCSPFLFIDLPSGRSLAYFKPHLAEGRFGTEMRYLSGAEYNNKVWLSTYGPKLFENMVQAISRDVLAAGMMRANVEGMDIVLHVHDEIAAEADEDDDQALPTLIECMTRKLSWCADAPIKAAGWEGKLYRKD